MTDQSHDTSPDPARPPSLASSTPHVGFAETPVSWRIAIAIAVCAVALLAYLFRFTVGSRGQACAGVFCFIGIVAACSHNLRAVNWRTVACGLLLQVSLAYVILRFHLPGRPAGMSVGTWIGHAATFTPTEAPNWRPGYAVFEVIGQGIGRFLEFSNHGAQFVFGPLANPAEMTGVFPEGGFVFAFVALPTIIFVSSFFSVLYYLGILQMAVRLTAKGMIHLMRTSGAETLSAVANVFMGQTEAPLIVKPYVAGMTNSELLALMVGGMATISGGVMAVYIQMGADPVAILATSVMAAPCGLYLAKIMLPETGVPRTMAGQTVHVEASHRNVIDAAAGGASDGLKLALNVAAMLIAFLAFIALFDALAAGTKPTLLSCGIPAAWIAFWPDNFSLAMLFSWAFAPLAFLMGAESQDVLPMADLLGTKLVTNEFVAYVKLTAVQSSGGYRDVLTHRGYILATYALTGFANLSSIGIQLGGIGAMAEERRPDLAALGSRALLVGFLATMINASIAGILIGD